MARKLGYVMSEESKKKISKSNTKSTPDVVTGKYQMQTLYYTKNEVNGFDFWPLIRKTLRPIGQHVLCGLITREVAQKGIWDNTAEVIKILGKYFHMVLTKE